MNMYVSFFLHISKYFYSDHLHYFYLSPIPEKLILSSISITIQACAKDLYIKKIVLDTYNNCNNFLQRSTEHVNFWQQAPPIWATATEQGLKISTYLWSRCDISWQDTKPISPAYCETVFQKDGSKTMRINMERALIDFQHGFDATIVSFRFGSNILFFLVMWAVLSGQPLFLITIYDLYFSLITSMLHVTYAH